MPENMNVIRRIKECMTGAEPTHGAPRSNIDGRAQISLKGDAAVIRTPGATPYAPETKTDAVKVSFKSEADRDNIVALLGLEGTTYAHKGTGTESRAILFTLPKDGRTNIKSEQKA